MTNYSYRQLYDMAFKDNLTQVYNRNMLEEMRSKYDAMHMYVTIVDIDGLKAINTKSGYEAGDNAIKSVAQYLESVGDVFRLGGDEFLLVTKQEPSIDSNRPISYGCICKSSNMTLADAMRQADKLMRDMKSGKYNE